MNFSSNNITNEEELNKLKDSLAKLYDLTDEEKSQEALLQGRIEEQSSLIMMLKKRSDEYIIRAQALDRDNKQISAEMATLTDKMKKEDKKHRIIQQNYNKMAHNYDELKTELERLQQLNDSAEIEKDTLTREIESLHKQVRSSAAAEALKKELKQQQQKTLQLENQMRELQEELRSTSSAYERESAESQEAIVDLRSELDLYKASASRAEQENQQIIASHRDEAQKLTTDLQNMKESHDQHKLMIKKQKDEMSLVRQKNGELEKKFAALKEKYEREADSINVSLQMKNLRAQLDKELNQRHQLKEEFDSYKAYSSKLLQTEKELNSRLRKLYS